MRAQFREGAHTAHGNHRSKTVYRIIAVAFAPAKCVGNFFCEKSLISAFSSSQKKKERKLPPRLTEEHWP
jgi:hypothetical protein